MTEATERHVFEIVSGEVSPQSGADRPALDLQRILGGKVKLRPVATPAQARAILGLNNGPSQY
jgi:hypothetical protein